jgi:hypothetical protein
MSKSSDLRKHYIELHKALFFPLDDIPLFINDYFNVVAKWRLKNAT